MLTIEVKKGQELAKKYQDNAVKYSIDEPFTKLVLQTEGEAKKSTVVKTGRLRSSISHRFVGEMEAVIGTNVAYAPFVEFGTKKMESRHVEGSTKMLGQGMFEYTIQVPMAEFLKDFEVKVVSNLEKELSD